MKLTWIELFEEVHDGLFEIIIGKKNFFDLIGFS